MPSSNDSPAFSPLALFLRPGTVAPALVATPWAWSTLLIGTTLGAWLVLAAVRHVGLGATARGADLLFLVVFLAPLAGYGGLLLAVRVGSLTLGARATASHELAQLVAWCLLPVLLAGACAVPAMLASGLAWFRPPQPPFWGGGAWGVAGATLGATASAWTLWLLQRATAARLRLSKASSALLVSSTIVVMASVYALLIVLLMTLIG